LSDQYLGWPASKMVISSDRQRLRCLVAKIVGS
jgi:hypothetical protein